MSAADVTPSANIMRDRVVGLDRMVPVVDGKLRRYVNLDNAATTPPLKDVAEAVAAFLPLYSSVHRGSGFKSRLSTMVYDQAHEIIARFVGADPETNTVIFGKNTTEAINKLSYRLRLSKDSVVISTLLEHHSNDLPWRNHARVVHVRATPEGRLDEDHFEALLREHADNVALVTVTAASNVTGFLQPVYWMARKAHEAGARILVDAAQFAPHRRVDMKPDDHPEHLDFVALTGHKMYAPLGTGALVGPKALFLESGPEYPGGGTVSVVTMDEVHWGGTPDRDEAGSPNVVGAVAMAKAAQVLMDVGMDAIAQHEAELTAYTLERLTAVPGITVYGDTDPARAAERVGVVPFNLDGVSHYLVAAVLGYEAAIGVRSGCFCAHPYVVHLLNLPAEVRDGWKGRVLAGDKSDMPGLVRASFGCYNTTDDVDRLVETLEIIAAGSHSAKYELHTPSGEYLPVGYPDPLTEYFTLE